MKKIKLFCIPYAGGSASFYKKWERLLDRNIKMCLIEIAGRGTRFKEQCKNNLLEIVDDLYPHIIEQIDDSEYAILGYSMGSIISYEIILKLQKDGYKHPVHAFFCAQDAPHKLKQSNIHLLPKNEFYNKIYKLGGTTREVIDNKEIQIIFEKILRSDYEAFETYTHHNVDNKILCKSTILSGIYDEYCTNIESWKDVIKDKPEYLRFIGNHFFINDYSERVFCIINNSLCNCNVYKEMEKQQ